MSLQHLGFRDLHYVISIAQCGSVSRAADACAITQPALSERLKRIEATLGVELFERSKRALRITAAGERFVASAGELLDKAVQMEEMLASRNETLSGTLRIGTIVTLGPYLMPHVIPALQKTYPKLELTLHEGLTDSLMSALLAGSLDAVIAATPLHASGIRQTGLFHEPFVLALPKKHPLALNESIGAKDLSARDMILLEDGHCLTGQALDICPTRKRHSTQRLHAMTVETLRHMVASGAGYSLLPSLAVGPDPALSNLIRYALLSGKRRYGRDIVIATRKSYGAHADIDALADLIRSAVPGNYGILT